jgi:hypothetical protein
VGVDKLVRRKYEGKDYPDAEQLRTLSTRDGEVSKDKPIKQRRGVYQR